MKILAINTASKRCSVALWKDGIVFTKFKECHQEHNKYILFLIQEILHQSNTILEEIDAMAFSKGPGSFTGIRININIVQALTFGTTLPIVGISTLATIAQGVWRRNKINQVITITNACTEKIYWAKYVRNKYGIWKGEETEEKIRKNIFLKKMKKLSGKWTIAGIKWKNYLEIVKKDYPEIEYKKFLFPEAEDMLPIALYFLSSGRTISIKEIEAIYL